MLKLNHQWREYGDFILHEGIEGIFLRFSDHFFVLFNNLRRFRIDSSYFETFLRLEISRIILNIKWNWCNEKKSGRKYPYRWNTHASSITFIRPLYNVHGAVYCDKTIFKLIENYSFAIFFLWPGKYIYHIISTSHKFYLCGEKHVHPLQSERARIVLEKPESIALTNYFLSYFYIYVVVSVAKWMNSRPLFGNKSLCTWLLKHEWLFFSVWQSIWINCAGTRTVFWSSTNVV